jgi:hypothetical protein
MTRADFHPERGIEATAVAAFFPEPLAVTQRSMSCSAAYFRRSLSILWRKRRTADDFVAEKRVKRGK